MAKTRDPALDGIAFAQHGVQPIRRQRGKSLCKHAHLCGIGDLTGALALLDLGR